MCEVEFDVRCGRENDAPGRVEGEWETGHVGVVLKCSRLESGSNPSGS